MTDQIMEETLRRPFPTIEKRLEEIMHNRGFTSPYTFSASLGFSKHWACEFIQQREQGGQIFYYTLVHCARKLKLIPAIIHKSDARRTPLFGKSKRRFRYPLDYEYLELAYIGDVMFLERTEKGLSQGAFARATGITRTCVTRYESYNAVPPVDKLQSICKALDLEAEWLAEPIVQSVLPAI